MMRQHAVNAMIALSIRRIESSGESACFDRNGAGIYKVPVDRRAVYLLSLCALCVVTASDRVARAESVARRVALQAVQSAPAQSPDPARDLVYICPMDPDVRSHTQ